jgi:hypothetical protein
MQQGGRKRVLLLQIKYNAYEKTVYSLDGVSGYTEYVGYYAFSPNE